MKLYNTLTRRKEEFTPLDSGGVRMYCCGPTVYNYAHIGNLRTYVFEDLLRRALEFEGYVVNHVMNITDVGHLTSDADEGEDKMLKGARREKKTVWEIAEFYTKAFFEDMVRLNLLHPTRTCKATDHIPEMIAQVRQLEKNGLTYISGGNVYFDTGKLPDYGKLAQLDKQELKAGARIEVDTAKKHPYDFVLWFTQSKHGNQDMQWDSPKEWIEKGVGEKGFPGWHIECSAMSVKYLGKQFDIHCGGIDHISVHHTNELAQAEGALKINPWVRFWLHGNFLVIGTSLESFSNNNQSQCPSCEKPIQPNQSEIITKNINSTEGGWITLEEWIVCKKCKTEFLFATKKSKKIAKSAENFLTLQTIIDHEDDPYDPLDYRYFCLQAHYRKELRFSWTSLKASKSARHRLHQKVQELGEKEGEVNQKYNEVFMSALNDDLNIPQALAVAWDLMDDSKVNDEDKLSTIKVFDRVLGLKLDEPLEFKIPEAVGKLLIQRNEARKEKNWKKSDELRAKIEKLGFEIHDLQHGSEIRPK